MEILVCVKRVPTVGGKIATAFARIAPTADFQAALKDPAVLANPANAPVVNMVTGHGALPSLSDSSFINALDPRLAKPFLEGFANSIDLVLVIAAAIMVLGVLFTAILPELTLQNRSGIQNRMDDEKAEADAAAVNAGV